MDNSQRAMTYEQVALKSIQSIESVGKVLSVNDSYSSSEYNWNAQNLVFTIKIQTTFTKL